MERKPALLSRLLAETGAVPDVGNSTMSGVQVAALSLLISVATSTFEFSKSSGVYPSSLRPAAARSPPLHRERDRRATHWESRSNSNLDDDRTENDDRDGGRSRISYSSFVEQRPSLGYSRRSEQSVKVSNKIDVTAGRLEDDPWIGDDCVPLTRKPFVLLTFGNAKKMLKDVKDLHDGQTYSESFDMMRCRRRIDGWNIQEPIYVDEPGWIVIDYDGLASQSGLTKDHDPFYVTRGKRSPQPWVSEIRESGRDGFARTDSINRFDPYSFLSSIVPRKNYLSAISSIKREPLDEEGLSGIPEFSMEEGRANAYLAMRDKHSDILDILNEPFYISRGRKSSHGTKLFERKNRYAEALGNSEPKKQALGGYFSRVGRSETARDCDTGCDELIVGSPSADDPGTAVADTSPYRDRRGVMEELLKQSDPFYVARGRRSMSATSRIYKDKKFDEFSSSSTESTRSTERINGDSSVKAKH